MTEVPFFINMPIPANRFTDVCALLAGSAVAVAQSAPAKNAAAAPAQSPASDPAASPASDAASTSGATEDATSPSDGAIDAHGHPWSAELHASTKGVTKDGLWRMKVGVSRPDPLPGFPVDNAGQSADTGTKPETASPSATLPTATEPATGPAAISGDDDEFAAFRNAAAASEAVDAAATASIPARAWTDADLGALCNQAAVKLGDPSPVKELIAAYTPEGEVAHSRNIPAGNREDFAKAVEAKAGIEFVG